MWQPSSVAFVNNTNNRPKLSTSSLSVLTTTRCCNCTACTSKPILATTPPKNLGLSSSRVSSSGMPGRVIRVFRLTKLKAITLLWSIS